MTDRESAVTAVSEMRVVADPQPSPGRPRPFARPTPTDGARAAGTCRLTPFLAPRTSAAASEAEAAVAAMTWPASAERSAANALDAVARRLRVGTFRLPVAVDLRSPPAVLAAVLAALHAEAAASAAEPHIAGSA